MLNKNNGDNEMYNFMQEWRKWFSDIIHNIENFIIQKEHNVLIKNNIILKKI